MLLSGKAVAGPQKSGRRRGKLNYQHPGDLQWLCSNTKKRGMAVRISKVEGGLVIQSYTLEVGGEPPATESTEPCKGKKGKK
jgi:hypothetical protein